MDSSFNISKSTVSFSSCKFVNDSSHSNYDSPLLVIAENDVSIVDCIFKKITGSIDITNSKLFIRGTHFLLNGISSPLIHFNSNSPESSLHIWYCRFESNEENIFKDYNLYNLNLVLINLGSVSSLIQDTVFYHNRASLVLGKWIEFTNCVFNSNSPVKVQEVLDGNAQFSNCSFSNNIITSFFSFLNVERSQVKICNCTFTNNRAFWGTSAIYLREDSSLLVENSIFVNNSGVFAAGAIKALTNCTLKMSYSIFKNNKVQLGFVGVISLEDESYMITDSCQFLSNTAEEGGGGAIEIFDHSLYSDEGSTFISNTAADAEKNEGGAISISGHSFLLLENSTFEHNSCLVEGGAITAHRNCSLNISHSIFRNNKALGADGGAIFLEDESSLESERCQFLFNTAALGGGAIMVVDHSSYTDTGSTFVNNTAADNGRFTKSLFLKISIFPTGCDIILASSPLTLF